jgi:uncharacterized protein
MKSLLEPDMKLVKKLIFRYTTIALTLLLFVSVKAIGQSGDIPARVNPPRLVNDFVGFLSADEQSQLERKLVAIDDSTTTQIAIVIVKSLNGYDISDYATRLGDKWGIGQKGKNNGILILVKPKTPEDNKREVNISTGYGAESAVPDAICKRIIDNEIVPSFQSGQYYQGLDKAVNTLYSLLRGEFTPDQYMGGKKQKGQKFPFVLIIILVVLFISFFSSNSSRGSQNLSRGGNLPFWLLMGSMMGGGRSGGGGFGDFNSGGGSFGGFGGGSFGGGGASGSW